MKNLILVTIVFLFAAFNIYSQTSPSIQFTGGIISPVNSYNGLTGSFQFNYPYNDIINFYLYTGYSSWNKNKVIFHEDYSLVQAKTIFNSYSADSHSVIPLFLGTSINFHSNKIFTAFVNFEIGYSYLSYYTYSNVREINPSTGEVLSYYVDKSTRLKVDENLVGLGLGIGLSHSITKNVNLILAVKLNSYLNSNYNSFLGPSVTWSNFLAGFNVKI